MIKTKKAPARRGKSSDLVDSELRPWNVTQWVNRARDVAAADDQTRAVMQCLLESVLVGPGEMDCARISIDVSEAVFLGTDKLAALLFEFMYTVDDADRIPKAADAFHKYGLLLAKHAPAQLGAVVHLCLSEDARNPADPAGLPVGASDFMAMRLLLRGKAWNGKDWVKLARNIFTKGDRETKWAAQNLLEGILGTPRVHDLGWDFCDTARVCKRMPDDARKAVAIAADKIAQTLQTFLTLEKYENESPEVVAAAHKYGVVVACSAPSILASVLFDYPAPTAPTAPPADAPQGAAPGVDVQGVR